MCTFCLEATGSEASDGAIAIHRAHTALFQDILTTTNNIALAMQAVFTVIIQMAFYDFLSEFDAKTDVSVTHNISVLIPVYWSGFTTVIAMLSVHLLMVLIILAMFLKSTRLLMLGNAWQAVAQASCGETERLLKQVSTLSEKEVRSMIRTEGYSDVKVGLSWSVEHDQACIVRRYPGGGST
ncbi:hypothetical protein BCR34DRAFT_99947 [Clohesyomyces aquaticus]|uniref:Uncharacterized protein n=1 Tax=Clohesyomyces aquaticus TaxID=1231657 RepID=A0A1Y1YTN2_9PLEO|nr:hypothetical protein BCR34DRAFT_99947 [Clohesyomyces aquaticus]